MRTIMWFAIESSRPEAEICRLEWDDNNADGRTGLVRDAKHPRSKDGNHLRFKYTPTGWEIIQQTDDPRKPTLLHCSKSQIEVLADRGQLPATKFGRGPDLRHGAVDSLRSQAMCRERDGGWRRHFTVCPRGLRRDP